ncbi:MAG: hypothetical protein AAFV32_06345 [Myxococcota bacterium]
MKHVLVLCGVTLCLYVSPFSARANSRQSNSTSRLVAAYGNPRVVYTVDAPAGSEFPEYLIKAWQEAGFRFVEQHSSSWAPASQSREAQPTDWDADLWVAWRITRVPHTTVTTKVVYIDTREIAVRDEYSDSLESHDAADFARKASFAALRKLGERWRPKRRPVELNVNGLKMGDLKRFRRALAHRRIRRAVATRLKDETVRFQLVVNAKPFTVGPLVERLVASKFDLQLTGETLNTVSLERLVREHPPSP